MQNIAENQQIHNAIFNEELYEVSKYYNSCLYKKIAINESGSVKIVLL